MKAAERVALYIREIEQIQGSRVAPGDRNFVNRKILADAAVGELQDAIARVEADPDARELANPGDVT